MAETVLIATGSSATTSDEFTLASGEATTVSLVGSGFLAHAAIMERKDHAGGFMPVCYLGKDELVSVLSGPGTYRGRRPAGSNCGVSRG